MANTVLGEKWVDVDGSQIKVDVTVVDNAGRDDDGRQRAHISYHVLLSGGERDGGALTTIVLDTGMTHKTLPDDVIRRAIAESIRKAMGGGDFD